MRTIIYCWSDFIERKNLSTKKFAISPKDCFFCLLSQCPITKTLREKNANSFKESNNTVLLNTRDEQAKISLIKLMLIVHLWCTSPPPPPPPPPPLPSPRKIELANRLFRFLLLAHTSQVDFALVM